MLARTVIIGNSGSGKSHLAESLSTIYSAPVVHLDQLFWMPGGFNEQRPKDEIRNTVELKRKEDAWIVEGVFGELAELFLPQAQSLIFLDMDWTVCDAGLLVRGSESSKQLEAAKAEENFENYFFGRNNIGLEQIHVPVQAIFNCFLILSARNSSSLVALKSLIF